MIKGFKEFIMRGNVVDLAVGVVIGAAFGALVTQLTASFIDPLIQLIGGGGELGGAIVINEGTPDQVVFDYGAFINAVITFLLTAAAIYFLVVAPYNHLRERRDKGQEEEVEPTNEEKMLALLDEIAANSRRQ
jgi:large conductance mechanosensitive channel